MELESFSKSVIKLLLSECELYTYLSTKRLKQLTVT